MSGPFDKREKSFEAKWAHDEELRFKTYARRNKLLGLWAAAEMGIIGPAADAYAKEVVVSDFERQELVTAGHWADEDCVVADSRADHDRADARISFRWPF